LVKDIRGRFYLPSEGFNNIPFWDVNQGYQVKVDTDETLRITGEAVEPDRPIPLQEGWSMVSYFPSYELDASAPDFYVLSPIIDHVLIAKDGEGNFMTPEFNFSNMPPWRETQGYQIKVDADIVLNYPPEDDNVATEFAKESVGKWSNVIPTGSNMSLLISFLPDQAINDGDQIAAFTTDNRLAGVGKITDRRCGLAVWSDDESTEAVEGLLEGETFKLKLWNADQNVDYDLSIETIHAGEGLVYTTDAFTALDVAVSPVVPDEFYLSGAYPNPFNNLTRIKFGLSEPSNLTVSVYDLSGRLITRLIDGKLSAGHYTAVWDAAEASTGVYIVWLDADGFNAVRKVILVK